MFKSLCLISLLTCGALNASTNSAKAEPVSCPPKAENAPTSTRGESFQGTIKVERIEVIGSTVFEEEDWKPIVKRYEGQELTLDKIKEVADDITRYYVEKGYVNSRARPATNQTIKDGKLDVLEIVVIEGRLKCIEIIGTNRLNHSYIKSRLQTGDKPLNIGELEERLRLLKNDPLLDKVEKASLKDTGVVGESKLIVEVKEAPPLRLNFSVDNYSPPSIGSEQFDINLSYLNLADIGDIVSSSYTRSTAGGFDLVDFAYQVPVNPQNGTVQLKAAFDRNEVIQPPFDELNIRGEKESYELNYRQPLVRNTRQEFALSLGFSYQEGQTFIFDNIATPFGIGPDEDGVSRTSVIKFGQEYIHRQSHGSWVLLSEFNLGTGLFDATTNDAPIPDGQFFFWLGRIQRLQKFRNNHLLILQMDLQLTSDSLLPAQKFIIGGGRSVRGYRQNARSGDNGIRFSLEDRFTVFRNESGTPSIQLAPFVDFGVVWNANGNPNELLDQNVLVSTGIGLQWDKFLDINGLTLRLDYGIPFIDLEDRGNNAQDEGFYFSLSYSP